MLIELVSECTLLNKNCPTMSNLEKLIKSSSPEVSTSISEFLEQERLCKELCSTIASGGGSASISSVGGKDIPRSDSALNISDLSDDDIGSILEKMSQIMSPSKSSQDSGSMSNSLYDGKQERNIEDILQEAEVLMQETVALQPPSLTNPNLQLEPSSYSRSHSPISRISSVSQSNHSAHKTGTDVSSLPVKKTDDIYSNLERTKVRDAVHNDETKDLFKELSVINSVSVKTNQPTDFNDKRIYSDELKVKDQAVEERKPFYLHDQSSKRQVPDLNRTFLVEPAAHTGSMLNQINPKSSPSKGNVATNKQNKLIKSQETSEYPRKTNKLKKDMLAQINSCVDTEEDSEEKCFREYMSTNAPKMDRRSVLSNEQQEELARKAEEMYAKLNEEIKVEIEQIIKSKAAKLDGLGTPVQTPTLNGDFPNLKLSYPGLETPSVEVPSCFNLEKEFLEERKRCLKLKADLEWIGRLHADEMNQLQKQHNEEMFALKKEIVLLTAQLSEKIPPPPPINSAKESERHKVEMLEKEMAEQEVLLAGYQRENELLCAELRSVKKLLKKLMSLLRKET